jgi:hypothetical protein
MIWNRFHSKVHTGQLSHYRRCRIWVCTSVLRDQPIFMASHDLAVFSVLNIKYMQCSPNTNQVHSGAEETSGCWQLQLATWLHHPQPAYPATKCPVQWDCPHKNPEATRASSYRSHFASALNNSTLQKCLHFKADMGLILISIKVIHDQKAHKILAFHGKALLGSRVTFMPIILTHSLPCPTKVGYALSPSRHISMPREGMLKV